MLNVTLRLPSSHELPYHAFHHQVRQQVPDTDGHGAHQPRRRIARHAKGDVDRHPDRRDGGDQPSEAARPTLHFTPAGSADVAERQTDRPVTSGTLVFNQDAEERRL